MVNNKLQGKHIGIASSFKRQEHDNKEIVPSGFSWIHEYLIYTGRLE